MKKKHKGIRNIAVVITAAVAIGLFVYGQQVESVIKEIERQIEVEVLSVEEKNTQLTDVKKQSEEMDSAEYIRKIATEELGMVEEDTIVFKFKE